MKIAEDRRIELWIILLYIALMLIGTGMSTYIFQITDSQLAKMTILAIGQIVATLGVNIIIKKHYKWEDIGFSEINKKGLIWFIPYIAIILAMGASLIISLYKKSSSINTTTWLILLLNLIGTIFAGFTEEVIFRGVLLNNIKKHRSIILAMIVSSIGFSIIHITTVFSGLSLFQAILRVGYTSLLGFAFVTLAIKINNLWPLIIFHIAWNYIIIASAQIGVPLSKASLFFNFANIIIGTILWVVIIRAEIKSKKVIENIIENSEEI
ncbi:CPBP family intramembrane glutamic endopeptidase [Romboutsia sp.]|uniref:CPBP family intramembrane glutamic endopeptidase n=1 Tax=Romboutsia sp. TaxID=1965302 RepID=UPI003F311A1A